MQASMRRGAERLGCSKKPLSHRWRWRQSWRLRTEQAVTAVHNYLLILAKFAQFLYLVQNDHDRAGHYFERAVQVESVDSEALSWYDLAGTETVLVKLDSDDED